MEPYIGITGVQFREEVSQIGERINTKNIPKIAYGVVLNLNETDNNLSSFDKVNEVVYAVKQLSLSCCLTIHLNGWNNLLGNEEVINRVCSIGGSPWLQLNGFDWRCSTFMKIKGSLPTANLILPYNAMRTKLENCLNLLFLLDKRTEMILIDQSEGRGCRLNIPKSISLVKIIRARCPDLSIGLAGGLGLGLSQSDLALLRQIQPTSVDAESGLYGEAGLDLKSVFYYFDQMYKIWS